MSALAIAILGLFSIPCVAVGLLALRLWMEEHARSRRLAHELDECLDQILAGSDREHHGGMA